MSRTVKLVAAVAVSALVVAGCNGETEVDEDYDVGDQPAGAAAMFVAPSDGATTGSPVLLEMAAEGVDVVAADAPRTGEGHFHVAVDVGCVEEGEVIPGPSDEAEADGHYHFGDGSVEADLDLDPGTYELCVQLADGVHTAFGDTDTIEITVE